MLHFVQDVLAKLRLMRSIKKPIRILRTVSGAIVPVSKPATNFQMVPPAPTPAQTQDMAATNEAGMHRAICGGGGGGGGATNLCMQQGQLT